MRNQRDSSKWVMCTAALVERLEREADDAAWEGRSDTELHQLYEYHRRRLLAGETLTPRF